LLGDFQDVQRSDPAVRASDGEISDGASAALRRHSNKLTGDPRYHPENLKQILRARNTEAGEDYVTLRNDRF